MGRIERDAFAASLLVARMADASLADAPLWDDLTTFDGRVWRGAVDLITAGLPCQPYSVAGKQKGNEDERALWPHFVRVVREVRPAHLFLENVPGFLKYFEPAWRELRGLGFEFAPPLLCTAHEVGATDRRQRLFLAATHPDRAGLEGRGVRGRERADERPAGEDGRKATHPNGRGREVDWGGWVFDIERETFRHDPHRCGRGCRTCGSHWETESPICRVAGGPAGRVDPSRTDRLRALGNCVTPQQAALAWSILMEGA